MGFMGFKFMNTFFNAGINLSKIPKEAITTDKNGNKWLNVTIWLNDNVDQYGNSGSIQINQSKDQRDAKAPKVYIGNLKAPEKKQPEQTFISGGSKFDDSSLPF